MRVQERLLDVDKWFVEAELDDVKCGAASSGFASENPDLSLHPNPRLLATSPSKFSTHVPRGIEDERKFTLAGRVD